MTRTLDRRTPVWVVLVLAFALLAWGELRSRDPYSSPAFVVGYVWTELQITALLVLATALLWPWRRLGLCLPQVFDVRLLVPLGLLVAMAVAARIWVGAQLAPGAAVDAATSALLLRTTLLVGLNEEWLFRGLALAAFSHWWGWRRGWMAALLAFGCVHLLNLLGGVSALAAGFQFLNTMLVGSVFLLAAVGSRSLLWPMLGHAVYDWAVIDASRYIQAGAPAWGSLLLPLVAVLLGLWSLRALWRLHLQAPYPEEAGPQ